MTKTALVTGSAGFIGRHMSQELGSRGYEVDGFDIRRRSGGLGDVNDLFAEGIGWESYAEHRYDLVVHAAYYVGGREGIDGINMNFAKNLELDAAMFEWAVRTKQRRVLYFSSCAAYPADLQRQTPVFPWGPIRQPTLTEDDINIDSPERPFDNYGWAKLMGERLAEDARANGLNVSVVRPFSGYGDNQSPDYPFRAILDRARQGDLSVWGPQGQSRDWIHVDDVINGSLAVADSGTDEPVNLCTGIGTEMGELARMIQTQEMFGMPQSEFTNVGKVTYLTEKPTGAYYRVGDPRRFHSIYQPKVTLEEGIRRAVLA